MARYSILVATTLFGYAFWALGERFGLGIFGCFLLSGAGSVLGVFAGWKFSQRFV